MKVGKDPTHLIVADKAFEHLQAYDSFDKKGVLADTPFVPYANHIQWNVIRGMVEGKAGETLICVSSGGSWDPATHPEKFLPSANRKTTGYARASSLDPAVATLNAERRTKQTEGMLRGIESLFLSYQKQGLPSPRKLRVPQFLIASA